MKAKVTRRQIAATLLSCAPLLPQTPAARQAAETDLESAARERVRKNAQTLASHEIPMATEPAFLFKP